MTSLQWKYTLIIIVLIVWSGTIFATFTETQFDKNYTDPDDIQAQKVYERTQ